MAAVRSSRGHFLLFTVLMTFCITASLANVELLEMIKENLKYFEENLEKMKADFEERKSIYINEMNVFGELLDPLMKEQRELLQSLPASDQVPFNIRRDNVQVTIDASKDQVNVAMLQLHREIVESERELESQRMKIKLIEEHVMKVHSEL